ncbi:MAG: ribosomal L7Ae/L30e/S12e/Gadd45 family protein [Clostridia bacterium]|nr:ribosomal L7Ae/L30e/S12e/Gadd45 family protein [Clostridia bacterium]
MLSEYRIKGLLVVGTKQTLKSLKEDRVIELYIAQDAENYVIREIKEMAEKKNIQITQVASMKKLGKNCGISVGAAVAGILKE